MKKMVILIIASLLMVPVTAGSTPRFSNSKKYFKQPTAGLFTPRSSGIARGNQRQQRRFQTANPRGHSKRYRSQRGRSQRFGSRGQGFNNQFNRGFNLNNRFLSSGRFNSFNRGFNLNNRFSYSRGFNTLDGGFIQFPGTGITFGGGYSPYSQPSLTISRKQLLFQRYLGDRGQRKRGISGKRNRALDLNGNFLYGQNSNSRRRGFGSRTNTPYSLNSTQSENKNPALSQTLPLNNSKTLSKKSRFKPQRWNPRRLKKTNPTRGVISSIPMTNRQKARLNF